MLRAPRVASEWDDEIVAAGLPRGKTAADWPNMVPAASNHCYDWMNSTEFASETL
jgi:hypothetical protein